MSGAGSFMSGIANGYMAGSAVDDAKARRVERKNAGRGVMGAALTGGGSKAPTGGGGGDSLFDPSTIDGSIASGIRESAEALGIDPLDLATSISYETAGSFDPRKKGPTTKWGQHEGFIQFGEPQAKEYGVNWDDPIGSQLGADGAVVNYLRKNGVKPGMGMLDIYSTINAGGPGRYGASDAAAGGAPGTVSDKVNNQMAGHRTKAEALLAHYAPAQPARMPRGIGGALDMGKAVIDKFYQKKEG